MREIIRSGEKIRSKSREIIFLGDISGDMFTRTARVVMGSDAKKKNVKSVPAGDIFYARTKLNANIVPAKVARLTNVKSVKVNAT